MLNVQSTLLIFNAFVVSNFTSCPPVWHMCSVSGCKKVEKIQERALRYVLSDFNETYTIICCKEHQKVYIIPIMFKNFSHINI